MRDLCDNGACMALSLVAVLAGASVLSRGVGSGSRAALSDSQRASMPQQQFAVPQRRTFPIDTRARAIKALAYAKWPNNQRWETQVRKAVFARYPELLAKYGTAAEKRRAA